MKFFETVSIIFIFCFQYAAEKSETAVLCNEDKLIGYLADIQVINPETIINLSTLDTLLLLCNKVARNLNELDVYLQSCQPFQQDLYIKLIQGVDTLYNKVCTNNTFANNFKNYYKCFQELNNELTNCNGSEDWTEIKDRQILCDTYRNIVDCYFMKTTNHCGSKAGHVMAELTIDVINSILVVKCDNINIDLINATPTAEELSKTNNGTTHQLNIYIVFTSLYSYSYFNIM